MYEKILDLKEVEMAFLNFYTKFIILLKQIFNAT